MDFEKLVKEFLEHFGSSNSDPLEWVKERYDILDDIMKKVEDNEKKKFAICDVRDFLIHIGCEIEKQRKLNERHQQIEQLKEKVEKDYQEIVEQLSNLDAKTLINLSYAIAVRQNFYDFIINYINDSQEYCEDIDFSDECMNKIINYKGNIIVFFYDSFMNFNHPERVDFWYGTDMVQIIEDCVKFIDGGDIENA